MHSYTVSDAITASCWLRMRSGGGSAVAGWFALC